MLYNEAYDDVYFVTHFLGGLKEEIRAPIALHRPTTVDTASALALLQEEELDSHRKLSSSRFPTKDFGKSSSKVFSATDKPKISTNPDDTKKGDKSSVDAKWAALLAYRKANGLCYTCGEKWTGRQHKCPDQVPIQMLQEVMELLQLDASTDSDSSDTEDDSAAGFVMAVHKHLPAHLKPKRRTMRFRGMAGKQDLLILLDSGSAGTFTSTEVAQHLSPQLQPCEPQQFFTADGTAMLSDQIIPAFQWFIQGHSFTYSARVLPLKSFDMIISADWLENHSPTWIHWKKKIMHFPLNGRRVKIQGIQDDTTTCSGIGVHKLKGLLHRKSILHCVEVCRVPKQQATTPSLMQEHVLHSLHL